MVGVQDVLDQNARILLQRVKPARCAKFLLQVLCKLELFSGTGGSFIQKKKRILDSKKRKSRLFLKKRIPSQCEFLASQFPNQIWNARDNDSICKVRGLFFEQRSRPPKADCLCLKNKGRTNVKSMVEMTTLSALYDAPISCRRGDWQDWEGKATQW